MDVFEAIRTGARADPQTNREARVTQLLGIAAAQLLERAQNERRRAPEPDPGLRGASVYRRRTATPRPSRAACLGPAEGAAGLA